MYKSVFQKTIYIQHKLNSGVSFGCLFVICWSETEDHNDDARLFYIRESERKSKVLCSKNGGEDIFSYQLRCSRLFVYVQHHRCARLLLSCIGREGEIY